MKKYIYGNNLRYSEYSSKDGGYCVYSVYGEDPNCDMGGSHICPFLGNVEGTFKDVLEHAANEMSRFYQWGGGGYIVPKKNLSESIEPVILNKSKKIRQTRKEKLNKMAASDVERLIETFETMTNDEIKDELENIKNKIIIGKKKL